MIKLYDDIEAERDRIQKCINQYGWTSDHNLDWFSVAFENKNGKSAFVEFDNGSGVLIHIYPNEWHIWSDPLCDKSQAIDRLAELVDFAFDSGIEKIWFKYVSDTIHSGLMAKTRFEVSPVDYSLYWPVLNMELYDPILPGGQFKQIRNAQNKFNREHVLKVFNFSSEHNEALHGVVDRWREVATSKEEESYVYDFWYHSSIDNGFKGFKTTRVLEVDKKIVGFNAGYEVVNNPGRFAGIIGVQDYSIRDMGLILWLEDLEWIKAHGYKELDMQGDEMNDKIKTKLRFGGKVERKTDTFLIKKL